MKATLLKREEIISGVWYIKLTTEEEIGFRAGQFFQLTLPNPKYQDNRGNSRFFGFINSPTLDMTAEMITKVGVSAYKRTLGELPIGSEVEIGKVGGEMTLPADTNRPLVFITEEIGVAPLMSILRFVQEKSLPYQITLIYSQPLIFTGELAIFSQKNEAFKFVTVMGGENLPDYIPKVDNGLYCVTGTSGFVLPTVKMLREKGIAPNQTKFEVFTGY